MSGDEHPHHSLPHWVGSASTAANSYAAGDAAGDSSTLRRPSSSSMDSSHQRLAALQTSYPISKKDAPTLPSLASLLALNGPSRRRSQPEVEHQRPPYTPVAVHGVLAPPTGTLRSTRFSGIRSQSSSASTGFDSTFDSGSSATTSSRLFYDSRSPPRAAQQQRDQRAQKEEERVGQRPADNIKSDMTEESPEADGSGASQDDSQVASVDGSADAERTEPAGSDSAAGGSGSPPQPEDGSGPVCSNCSTKTTPLWRRDGHGGLLCNACGLFAKVKGRPRPHSLKTDVIKPRARKNRRQSIVHPSQLGPSSRAEYTQMAARYNPHAFRAFPPPYDGRPSAPLPDQAYPEPYEREYSGVDQRSRHPYVGPVYRRSPPPQHYQAGASPLAAEATHHPRLMHPSQGFEGGPPNSEHSFYHLQPQGHLSAYGHGHPSVASTSMPDARYMYRPEGYSPAPSSPQNPDAFYPARGSAEELSRERLDPGQAQYGHQYRPPSKEERVEAGKMPPSGRSPNLYQAGSPSSIHDARGKVYQSRSPAGPGHHEPRNGSTDGQLRLPPIALALSSQHRSSSRGPTEEYKINHGRSPSRGDAGARP